MICLGFKLSVYIMKMMKQLRAQSHLSRDNPLDISARPSSISATILPSPDGIGWIESSVGGKRNGTKSPSEAEFGFALHCLISSGARSLCKLLILSMASGSWDEDQLNTDRNQKCWIAIPPRASQYARLNL